MKLGISLTSAHAVEDVREGARFMIERARAARDAGLDSLTLGDHHATPIPYYQNVPMLGRLLAEWDGPGEPRPAGCLFLLPLWNPVLVAEQVGTLAALCRGRFIVQTGLGAGAQQFAAMGKTLRERGAILEEAVLLIRRLLAGETVSNARFGVRDAMVCPQPTEAIEWWIGGGVDAGLERAARLGDAWYADPGLTPERARERLDRYREACARAGRRPRAMLRKDVFVAPDAAYARRLVEHLLQLGYRGLSADALAFGTPAQVAERLQPFAEMGFEAVIVRTMSVPQVDALGSIEGCGEVRRLLRA